MQIACPCCHERGGVRSDVVIDTGPDVYDKPLIYCEKCGWKGTLRQLLSANDPRPSVAAVPCP